MTERALDNKIALITGGSRGVGRGIASRLAQDGATVVFTYANSPDRAEDLVAEIRAQGGKAEAIRADNLVESDIEDAVTRTVALHGSLDILVNNAGVASFGPIEELAMDDIDAMLTINVRSTVLAIRAALEHMGEGGRIVNIGSINAERVPYPGQSIYALTKGALAGLTRGLARELAPRGITINNVQPGPIDTDANPAEGPFAADMLSVMALNRYGTSTEVGALVSYLSGPDAGFVTGANLNIDGGFTA